MKLHKILIFAGFIVPLTSVLVLANSQEAKAGCGWLDPTCRSGPGDCLFGACPKPSESHIPRDPTPPRVRTARNMMNQGYKCVEIAEFPATTCHAPNGMSSSEFQVRFEQYWGTYLSPSRDYSWNCLNRNGQLWGSSTNVRCVDGMR